MTESDAERRSYDVGVLVKALHVIEALGRHGGLGLGELAAATGANKASVYRILATLESRDFLVKDPTSRKYTPGPRLVSLAKAIVDAADLVRHARPVLLTLREEFGETLNLGVLSDGKVEYLEVLESPHSLRMTARTDGKDDLHSTALGKAILSRLEPGVARSLLGDPPFPAHTRRTVTTRAALERDLARTRERGYAIDDEENQVGARCVAAPALDKTGHPIAAISVSGPAARMDSEAMERMGARLAAAAAQIAEAIGAAPAAR